jgi:hypothetical protein
MAGNDDGDKRMTSTKEKRIDSIEAALTPKEWAIKTVDQWRSFPSEAEYIRAMAKDPAMQFERITAAMRGQAKEKHRGNSEDVIRARIKFTHALQGEYHSLRTLTLNANIAIMRGGEAAGLKAALILSKLEKIVLQDAFGRTARKAAEWIEEYKKADKVDEENRQIMLQELAAYANIDFGEKLEDSIPLPGGLSFRIPSVIENLVAEVVTLALGGYGVRAAVQSIQDQYFDGHSILFLNVEAGLDSAIKHLEEGIETFNHYLKTRAELFENEWEADAEENDGIASAIPGEREGRLSISIDNIRKMATREAKRLAAEWVKEAKDDTKEWLLEGTDEDALRRFSMSRMLQKAGTSDDKGMAP